MKMNTHSQTTKKMYPLYLVINFFIEIIDLILEIYH